jgi:hypothetical protein
VLDAYRQVYFESKLRNRTLMREYERSGALPPRCPRTVNITNDLLDPSACKAIELPLCETWEQYWAEWEKAWAAPPDTGSDIAMYRYKMPHITDVPPEIGLSRISVTEKPIFSDRLFPDSVPPEWPDALWDVLHERYDEVSRIMEKNLQLLEAANAGNIEEVVQLLREGALIHTGDSNNQYMTPLHHAAFEGHVELIHVLVSEEGADIDRTTLGGETALHKAVQGKQLLAVQALLQLGANPNVRSGLEGCPRGKQPGMGWTPLFRASLLGLTDMVRMLVAFGAEVTPVSTVGWTPLHYAALWAHNETVEALLELGADPMVRTKHGGHTPYDRAMMSRFAADSPIRPMRQLYKSVIEKLKEAMRRACNGREPDCHIPAHWKHGDMMPDEVEEEHRRKWSQFYDGSWVREWRRNNGCTEEDVPTREELEDVMAPWLREHGVPCPRLQALRGGGGCRRYRSGNVISTDGGRNSLGGGGGLREGGGGVGRWLGGRNFADFNLFALRGGVDAPEEEGWEGKERNEEGASGVEEESSELETGGQKEGGKESKKVQASTCGISHAAVWGGGGLESGIDFKAFLREGGG